VNIDELMDVASEPHEFNIYIATNFSALVDDIADQLTNTLCNSKYFCKIVIHCLLLYVSLCKDVPNLRFIITKLLRELTVHRLTNSNNNVSSHWKWKNFSGVQLSVYCVVNL